MTSSTLNIRPSPKLHLDIDELIREVHYRPALWNKNCVGYTDRRLKARMWDEVFKNIIDNWKQLQVPQQNTISIEIQKKWRNVKDAFNKEMKKISAGQDNMKKKQYCHFKALSFLSNSEVYTSKSAISMDGSDDESDNASIDQESNSTSSTSKRARNKNEDEEEGLIPVKREKIHFDEDNSNSEHNRRSTDKNEDNLLEIDLEKPDYEDDKFSLNNRDECPNRHFVEIKCDDWDNESNSQILSRKDLNKNFIKSRGDIKVYDEDISFSEMMIPMMKKLNYDQKHFAKIEILNILHKAKCYHSSSSCGTQTEQIEPNCNERDAL